MYRRALSGGAGAVRRVVERRVGTFSDRTYAPVHHTKAGPTATPGALPIQRWARPQLEQLQRQQVRKALYMWHVSPTSSAALAVSGGGICEWNSKDLCGRQRTSNTLAHGGGLQL